MSTRNKLDPRVRRDRAARKELLNSLRAMESQAIRAGHPEFAARAIGALDMMRGILQSDRHGADKQKLFSRIVRELMQSKEQK